MVLCLLCRDDDDDDKDEDDDDDGDDDDHNHVICTFAHVSFNQIRIKKTYYTYTYILTHRSYSTYTLIHVCICTHRLRGVT